MPTIRRLRKGEWQLYKRARLRSLKDAPEAFSSTYESAAERTDESWIKQADNSAEGADRFTFVALTDDYPVEKDKPIAKEKPIGLAALYRDAEDAQVGEMIQVWIDPNHRGSGLTNCLMDALFETAKENSFTTIKAEVINSNKRALRYYERYGFTQSEAEAIHTSDSVMLEKRV